MSEPHVRTPRDYRAEIVGSLTPVRPLPAPARRVWILVPIGILLAVTAPFLGARGDLTDYAPLLTWGVTAVQSFAGLWLLALGFREAVPGRNVSTRALSGALVLSAVIVIAVTLATNAVSATVVPDGVAFQFWFECVIWPFMLGAPFMMAATLMAARAFPTRPAITGALCGLSAGLLSDAGWRLSCWISEPAHVLGSHGLAIVALTAAGTLVAVCVDLPRWRRLRHRSRAE